MSGDRGKNTTEIFSAVISDHDYMNNLYSSMTGRVQRCSDIVTDDINLHSIGI